MKVADSLISKNCLIVEPMEGKRTPSIVRHPSKDIPRKFAKYSQTKDSVWHLPPSDQPLSLLSIAERAMPF